MKKANKNLPDGLMSNTFVCDEAWVAWRVMTWHAKSLSPWGDETLLQPPGFVGILRLLRPLDFSSQPFEDERWGGTLAASRLSPPFTFILQRAIAKRGNDNA